MASLELQRAALRLRQHEVIAALLRGDHPAGFAEPAASQTTRILLGRRADEVAHVCGELGDLPDWRRHFARYAATHPAHREQGCAHTQMSDFTSWMRARADLTRDERGWLGVADVHASRSRVAFARLGGRRVLFLGWGHQVRAIPLSVPRHRDQGG